MIPRGDHRWLVSHPRAPAPRRGVALGDRAGARLRRLDGQPGREAPPGERSSV